MARAPRSPNKHGLSTNLMSRRRFLKLGCGTLMSGATLTVVGAAYATRIEPDWIEVRRQTIPLPTLPDALDGLTITQVSDLHLGPYVDVEDVRTTVKLANELNADVIVLTGDFVYRSAGYSRACARELQALRARHGVYAVLGNHDMWTDADEVAGNLTDAGITVLRNQRTALEVDGARLWLLGIEDAGYTGRLGDSFRRFRFHWRSAAQALEQLLDGLPKRVPRLLLVHNPDFTEMVPAGQIDLVLCGHTHGGQVRLPVIGAPVVPSCFGQKYVSGFVRNANTLVYVNRGIGMTALPVRFNCRPEITIFRLQKGNV